MGNTINKMDMKLLKIALVLLIFAAAGLLTGCASTSKGTVKENEKSSGSGGILPWQSGNLKIGYIRSDVISKEYPEYRDAEATLKNENKQWIEEAEEMEEKIREKELELDDLALILTDERKEELMDQIADMKKELQKFRHETWYDENSNYIKRRKELMEPIDARVNDAIWEVAEDKNLDVVFDTVAGNIVFVKPSMDITEDVIEELTK